MANAFGREIIRLILVLMALFVIVLVIAFATGFKAAATESPHIRAVVTGTPAPGTIYTAIGSLHPIDPAAPDLQPYLIELDSRGNLTKAVPTSKTQPIFSVVSEPNGQFVATKYIDATGRWDGVYDILGANLNLLRTVRFIGDPDTDIHGIAILTNGDYLVPAYHLATTTRGLVEEYELQEQTPGGAIVFSWNSINHVPLSAQTATDTRAYWVTHHIDDYFHGNSVAELPGGDLLVSSRNTSAVYRISRKTGAIVWQLGGKHTDFTFVGDPYGRFAEQHDVSMLPNGHILMYDNGTPERHQSRAAEYALDMQTMTATLVWSYDIPGMYTPAYGSVERLSDGHTFINWGMNTQYATSSVRMTEVDASGTPVLSIYLDPGYETYLAFKK